MKQILPDTHIRFAALLLRVKYVLQFLNPVASRHPFSDQNSIPVPELDREFFVTNSYAIR
ncbi:MAG: hypothetical protein JXR71_09725 [Bacteroidales bacterium]|nr:hypothetical protein [Bacteroidales bacterium]